MKHVNAAPDTVLGYISDDNAGNTRLSWWPL